MGPELARLAAAIGELGAALARVQERVASLERDRDAARASGAAAPSSAAASSATAPSPTRAEPTRHALALVGRTLIFVGGAYLLRAGTDLGLLPPALGAALALVYAGALVLLGDRAAARGDAAAGSFTAAAALAIAAALIDEMVVRLQLVGPAGSALLLALVLGAGGVVALRRRLPPLAWILSLATVATVAALAVQTQVIVPYVWLLALATAGATLLGRRLDQRFVAWPPLVLGTLLVLADLQLTLVGRSSDGVIGTLAAACAFFSATAAATLFFVEITPLEMGAMSAVFTCTLLGGAQLAWTAGARLPFGVLVLAIGAGGWVAGRSSDSPRFWTSLFFAAALVGVAALSGGVTLVLLCLLSAAALLATARRAAPAPAPAQALAALVVAALQSGLAIFALAALTATPDAVTAPAWPALLVLAAMIAVALVLPEPAPGSPLPTRLVRPAALGLAFVAVAALLSWLGVVLLHAGAAVAATVRSFVLAGGAVGLALASRARARSAGVLVYPVLAVVAAKLLLEDLRVGTPATLFVDLALVGVAFVLAPRLRAPTSSGAPQPQPVRETDRDSRSDERHDS